MRIKTISSNNLSRFYFLICLALLATPFSAGTAQTKPAPAPPQNAVPVQPVQLPFTAQLRKAVVLINSYCEDDSQANVSASVKTFSGTGFLVSVPDASSPDKAFQYLVTNRHVAQPGIENGKPCKLLGSSAMVNPKDVSSPAARVPLPAGAWIYPDDDGVDLAAMAFGLDPSKADIKNIPLSLFIDDAGTSNHGIIEGDPVIFSGLFVQFPGVRRFEPIVREGRIAMIPSEKVVGTLRKPASILLTEAHAYGGNSGSPMFVDLAGIRNGALMVGNNYKFIGVVAGEVQEGADFTLNVTTTYKGQAATNSGISLVVPANEVRALLLNGAFEQQREFATQRQRQQTQ
jgi:hypothetical protein